MKTVGRGLLASMGGLLVLLSSASSYGADCVPPCREGFTCAEGTCVSACSPACAANQVCTPDRQCVSACNPPCAPNEICTPERTCVSACNPPCGQGTQCTPAGACEPIAAAPQPPPGVGPTGGAAPAGGSPPGYGPAPAPAYGPGPAPAPGAPPPAGSEPAAGGKRGFFQAGAVLGRYSYTGEWNDGTDVEGTGFWFGAEGAGGIQLSEKFRLGVGAQYLSLPNPEGKANGVTHEGDTTEGGAIGAYFAWGGDGGLIVDGIAGYGGIGEEDVWGGTGLVLMPGLGYQSTGSTRFAITGRVVLMPSLEGKDETGSATGFQAVASFGVF